MDIYKPEGALIDTPENREYTSSLASLEYAMNSGAILEGRAALCDSSHALIVEFGAFRGVIPRSEAAYSIDGSEIRDIAVITRVGKPVCFKITGIAAQKSHLLPCHAGRRSWNAMKKERRCCVPEIF